MSISVPSRFAVLKVEDDDDGKQRRAPKEDRKKPQPQPQQQQQQQERKSNGKKNNQKQNGGAKKEKKVKQQMDKQWEEWKRKDDKLVNGNFEQDLESAILLSKLHYEENKDKYSKGTDPNKKPEKKKQKKNVMSLNQFLAPKEKISDDVEIQVKSIDQKENFFDTVHTEAKKELSKDQLNEQRRLRDQTIDEKITAAQYQHKLELERKINQELEVELQKAREEISDVRLRNQTLCTMLSTGEMKDKADVLLELERLNIIKNDLTDEVSRLHGLLEQERSKVAALTNDNSKHKKNKKHA